MYESSGDLLMSQAQLRERSCARWRTLRLVLVTSTVVIFTIPVALLPFAMRQVQPTAEFVFLVIAPSLWNSVSTWISPPCLYVVLNIVILTLGVKSGALRSSVSDAESCCTCLITPEAEAEHKADIKSGLTIATEIITSQENTTESRAEEVSVPPKDSNPALADEAQKPQSVLSSSLKPASVLYCKQPRSTLLRRSETTTKLSNLSRESRERRQISSVLAPMPDKISVKETAPVASRGLVVFEICAADEGEAAGDNYVVDEVIHRDEGILSSDELYAKAESFIGNFYRELKMQREDSWKRLCAIYRQSC
uniref:TSA: Wollemia nobilis Ref_Wollemi_Transcript_7256_1416 transcribed RNA sequence n=1 Tax=Wollemia nobilis TaxID=56998 RepID=A0A0C9RNZ5_9CONI